MKILIRPLEGIFWEDKSIVIGEERKSVEKAFIDMSFKDKREGNLSFYLFNNNVRVDFDKNNHVEFIELSGEANTEIQAIIYGVDIFKTKSDELVGLLRKHNDGEIEDSENGYCYAFKNISVGIWRESTPESLVEFLEEIRNDESIHKLIVEEKVKEEMVKANYWATLGVGVKGYYL